MGLVCGTPTKFMPATAAPDTPAARTAQATTITPALGAWVKNATKTLYYFGLLNDSRLMLNVGSKILRTFG